MPRREWAALAVILAFVATRGLLGALVNPPFNGPDERGHVLEIAAVLHPDVAGGERVSQRQPRPYYLGAALYLRLLGIPVDPEHLDWRALLPLRLASVLMGTLTTAAAYLTARYALRSDPSLALAAALVAGLAPAHQFIMASAANDSLSIALAAASAAAAIVTVTRGWSRNRALVLVGTAIAATATKSTGWGALAIAAAVGVAALWRHQQWTIPGRWLAGAGVAGVLLGLGLVQLVVRLAAGSFFVTLQLPFLLPAAWGLPANYLLGPSGLSETFRTFWVQPDYGVAALPAANLAAALLVLVALVGGVRLAFGIQESPVRRGPALVLIGSVAVQLMLIGYRYSLAVEKDVLLGGAAQAKFVLPALPAIAVLLVVGWAGSLPVVQRRWLPAVALVIMLALDAATLLPFIWEHYQWLELRPA